MEGGRRNMEDMGDVVMVSGKALLLLCLLFNCLLIYCFYVFRCEYSTGECVEEEGKKEEGKNLALQKDLRILW